jgi:hypothetical protein
MEEITITQVARVLAILKELSRGDMDELLASGILSDLCEGKIEGVDRDKLREMLGLKHLYFSLLAPLDPVTIGTVEPFNPNEFFTTRGGLWVSHNAKEFLLSDVGDEASLPEGAILQPFMLTETSEEATIWENLPENCVFGVGELRAILKHTIEVQWGGKWGILDEKNYNWNVFFVRRKVERQVYVLGVHLGTEFPEWRIHVRRLGDRRWNSECLVFSRVADL